MERARFLNVNTICLAKLLSGLVYELKDAQIIFRAC
ncbi:hypothetical protein SAMN04490197_4641 [Pseudomonas orientalis]|uniref:Uncharacterized protein n=1 Tax=Pseudomonas orientalis TaxID=76758 RepID=A0A8B3Y2Q0_9PSED|nr:hypothetical protein SAMN04490197_4641 [Pseudomonas orientalis]